MTAPCEYEAGVRDGKRWAKEESSERKHIMIEHKLHQAFANIDIARRMIAQSEIELHELIREYSASKGYCMNLRPEAVKREIGYDCKF